MTIFCILLLSFLHRKHLVRVQANALHMKCTPWRQDIEYRALKGELLCAGYQVAKDALGGSLTSEHLTIGGRRWKLKRGKQTDEGEALLC